MNEKYKLIDYLSNTLEHDTEEEAVNYLLENCGVLNIETAKNLISSYLKEQKELMRASEREMLFWVDSKIPTEEIKKNPAKPLIEIVFVGYDDWSQATFKDAKGNFFCDISCSDYSAVKSFEKCLYFKGKAFDGEPHYPVYNLKIVSKL